MTLCGFDTGAIRIVRSWRSADVDIVCRPVDRLRTDLMRVFAACSGMRVAREKVTAEPTQHLWIPLLDGTVKQLNVEIDVPRHHAFVYPYLNDWRNAWVLGFHGPMVRIELLSGEPPVVLMDCPSDIRRRAAVGNGTHECWDDEFFQIERYVWIKGRMVQCTIVDRLGTYRDERDYLRMMCASMRIVAAR
jgi:hypothetical protein